VGDDEDGVLALALQQAEGLGQLGKGPQVDAGLRLVKDEQAAGAGQNGRDLDALDLAAGEGGVHLPVHIVGGAQADPVEIGTTFVPAQVPVAGGQGQQVPDPQALKARGLLEAVADAQLGPLGDGKLGDVLSVPQDLPARGGDQAHDGLGQGGLAAAVGAGDDHKFVVVDGQVDAPENVRLGAVVLHLIGKSFQFQHR